MKITAKYHLTDTRRRSVKRLYGLIRAGKAEFSKQYRFGRSHLWYEIFPPEEDGRHYGAIRWRESDPWNPKHKYFRSEFFVITP